ncbi:heavy metal sensor histidine kinase [Segnochrobactrum spirostomi]|uniref:Sensor protein n=1 Tax=Segnochrobactrum spirostomi TaxID=2608987 RepID=A0A6A7Y0V5_9HYPH|nr:heavy metal sensor histidine kinase [Segnochrobactrum spirostomi]MQT11452.1 heavy metal sensor histidine kinase [Segnochrobactrum spirostomi]
MIGAHSSLTLRAAAACALIISTVMVVFGLSLDYSVRFAMDRRVETMVVGRAAYFGRLIHEMYSADQLRDRPLLIANMLGAEQDVLVFRKPDGGVLVEVNPDHLPLPPIRPEERGAPEVPQRTVTPDGLAVVWASTIVRAAADGSPVEILVGHPMSGEAVMLDALRRQIVLVTALAVAAASLLTFVALRRGMRPLRRMAARAEEIAPGRMDLRFDVAAAPAELAGLAEAINAMLDRLAAGYQRLSQFSADLAHEIRTPLGVLIGQTQVALGQPRAGEDYREVLESNLEELERLRRLSDNILFLARADNAAADLDRSELSLAVELERITDYFEGPAAERGIRFAVEADGTITANAELFRRAVGNLVVNAVRHGTTGSLVRVVGTADGGGARVVVENHGHPLSGEQLARVFDRFYRVDPARNDATESNGLGLAIVQAIMVLHGGRAEATCSDDGLFRFTLTFP